MPKVSLTDLVVQNLRTPENGQVDYWDASLSGFGVRVSKGGTKTFVALVHRNRKALGKYPAMSLKEARNEAKRRMLTGGIEVAQGVPVVGYQEAVDRYLQLKQSELRPSTLRDYQRILKRFEFSGTIDEMRPYQIADAIERIRGQTDKSTSFTVLKVFFGWCMQREYCRSNPLQNLKKPKVPISRERVLEDDELAVVWKACEGLGKYGSIVRLLILTGQRREQIARLQGRWVDKDRILFPASVMKNKVEHYCPIGSLARFTLLEVIPIEGYYFSPISAVGRPFSAWSKSKKRLDELTQLDPWRLHDLRRTWASNAPRLDIPQHVTSRILSHTAPEGGMAKIYNRYGYRKEMAAAMHKMNDHILSLLTDEPT